MRMKGVHGKHPSVGKIDIQVHRYQVLCDKRNKNELNEKFINFSVILRQRPDDNVSKE